MGELAQGQATEERVMQLAVGGPGARREAARAAFGAGR
jgi:hypothetical protein